MNRLVTAPNLGNPDDFYAALLRAHEGLSVDEGHALNARLILVLANHIGDPEVLQEALDVAGAAGGAGAPGPPDPTRA